MPSGKNCALEKIACSKVKKSYFKKKFCAPERECGPEKNNVYSKEGTKPLMR